MLGTENLKGMVETNEFNPSMLEPSDTSAIAGNDESLASSIGGETDTGPGATSTEGEGASTDEDESWSTNDPSEFSRSYVDSKSSILGDNSLQEKEQGSQSLSTAPEADFLNSERSKQSALLDEPSIADMEQDESLRSGSKVDNNQEESLRSNVQTTSSADHGYDERSLSSEDGPSPSKGDSFLSGNAESQYSQSEYSQSRTSMRDESYSTRQETGTEASDYHESEYSQSRTSTYQDESYSTRQENEGEESGREVSQEEKSFGSSSSTRESPSMTVPAESSQDEDKTEEFEQSMMIGEVFGL